MKDTPEVAALKRVREAVDERFRSWNSSGESLSSIAAAAFLEALKIIDAEIRRLRQEQEQGDA